jgi:hypothetical protein
LALLVLAFVLMLTCALAFEGGADSPEGAETAERSATLEEVEALVGHDAAEFLLTELRRVQPPRRIRRLARYQAFQSWLGAGFDGQLPNQLVDPQAIPIPKGEDGLMETARVLARQRRMNRDAIATLEFPRRHWEGGFSSRLGSSQPPGLRLEIEWGVVEAFLEAMEDGEVSIDEAREIARLPANREMILAKSNRRSAGPRMTEESLAVLIAGAGSPDPLDRLWCWLNPANQFGYADLVMNQDRYRQIVAALEVRGDALSDEVCARLSLVVPSEIRADVTFALTVGGLEGSWATDEMVGESILSLKDDWNLLAAAIAEDTFRYLLPRFCLTPTGERPDCCEDLVRSRLDDQRYDPLFEMIAKTLLEGAAHLVACPACVSREGPQAAIGVEYISSFIDEVIHDGHILAADEYLCRGMCDDGPLYHLGRYLVWTVTDHDGPGAVGCLLEKGPIAVLNRAWEIEAASGAGVLTEELMSAVGALSVRLERSSKNALRIDVIG